MPPWINFRELRKQLTFEQVLQHYKVAGKIKGKQFQAFCSLPNHGGDRCSPSFSANLEKGIFQCFGCGAKGNLLDFAVLMDGGNPESGDDLRKTAVKLRDAFNPAAAPQVKKEPPPQLELPNPAVVNAPLDFALKTLDATHPYLWNRGFTDETIATFGLGYCSKGYLKGRIAIPLHDGQGRLIGYAGRIADDSLITEAEPRYKFPGAREHKGTTYGFRKSEFLYNGHRIQAPVEDLIVVEGFPSVWWLHQHGFANVVALMGSTMSQAQCKSIVVLTQPVGRIRLMPDGDEAGIRCAESALLQITPHRFTRWVKINEGKQPTDYGPAELKQFLTL